MNLPPLAEIELIEYMIKCRKDYDYYLSEDLKNSDFKPSLRSKLFNEIWRYQRLLRKNEYYHNCKKGIFNQLYCKTIEYRRIKLGNKLGFSIPINVFGPGLSIAHVGTIVVNDKARVGANCRIHICVNIGADNKYGMAPRIGDNVYIGPGVKMFGNISIADNTKIGANAVVNKSFTRINTTIAGVPAKVIS